MQKAEMYSAVCHHIIDSQSNDGRYIVFISKEEKTFPIRCHHGRQTRRSCRDIPDHALDVL